MLTWSVSGSAVLIGIRTRRRSIRRSATRRATGISGRIPEEDRELVAADPGGQVAGPQRRLDALADGRQERVAGGVAEGVVDDLEVVEVEEQHDRDQPGGVGRLESLGHALGEERPVGEPGQRVVIGLVLELFLEP